MKKWYSLLLALVMMLGCFAYAEGVDYTGTWMLTGMIEDGILMGSEAITRFGKDLKVILNDNGTAIISFRGEKNTGFWFVTKKGLAIYDSGATVEAIYRNDMLIMSQNGNTLMLTREGATPAIAAPAAHAVLSGVDPAAFEGHWLLTSVIMMGAENTAEDMEVCMELLLEQGWALMGTADNIGIVSYIVNEAEGIGTVCTLVGKDKVTGESAEAMKLSMLDDGRLVWKTKVNGVEWEGYFTKQVAE